ncbi:MAG: type II CRISPR RNA-guided endonuclease Cas9 [Coriobacteriales bacterium]|nr:type II CRISPR RNA-guided endonuclease Cas9 [Coriobacteriales bacterium]
MNLRNAQNYTIGLDLGTNSVGWSVVDENGNLFHIKGKPTWGSRLFPDANTAAETRLIRGQRRRIDRKRQRIDCLQAIFLEEMSKVDEEFFVRLNQTRLWKEDRNPEYQTDYRWPLFNDTEMNEAEYYKRFPTIYHLRRYLMQSDNKEDIRLIYLALHNIIKYRGNFLHEDEGSSLKAANADATKSAQELSDALEEYIDLLVAENPAYDGCSIEIDRESIKLALDKPGIKRADRIDSMVQAIGADGKPLEKLIKEVSKAIFGSKVNFTKIFPAIDENAKEANFSIDSEDGVSAFIEAGICPDEAMPLFDAIQRAYSSYVLSGMLQGCQSISEAKIKAYEQHADDLRVLKDLLSDKRYFSAEVYRDMFRGEKDSSGDYDINALPKNSYTAYVHGEKSGCSHDDLLNNIRKIISNKEEILEDERYQKIQERLSSADSDFLAKLKTRSNGAIPYQLHLEELESIIDHQGKHYQFLQENRDLLVKIVSSRIPYYVGPLNTSHDPADYYPNNRIDTSRKFGWAIRKSGAEGIKAYPWNVDEVIDIDVTAERFIQRMTGTCTYLFDEPVLPRCSLLYEEFCVLNELNSAKWARDNGQPHRFDSSDRKAIIEDKFKSQRTVKHRSIQEWLRKKHGEAETLIIGTQAEDGFESRLNSYNDFCNILNVKRLEDQTILSYEEIEEIILWNTVFEDRELLERKIEQKYGNRLTDSQIKAIIRKRYTGWGRLSKKLLTGITVPANVVGGAVSIMDVMRMGNPFDRVQTVNFMEIITNKDLGFNQKIDEINEERYGTLGRLISVDDLQGSPTNRRTVNQAMRIVEEIIKITGKDPARICIEVTRDDDVKKQGKRTKTRYTQLKNALDAFQADTDILEELNEHQEKLDSNRLMLYFAQNGKCMYSREPLDINRLNEYQIDHIIPQSYIKDDSLDNTVLVKSDYNQRKLDSLLLDEKIIQAQGPFWAALLHAGLISRKKFNNLTCRDITERQMIGFINRQLVETSQVIKFVRQMCEQRYPNTEIVSVRANITHGVRENWGLVKCRELNNYHHAHDAFLACQSALFVGRRYPKWQDGFDLAMVRKYVKSKAGEFKNNKKLPGKSGFIADSFTDTTQGVYVDPDTGEILWDPQERKSYVQKVLTYKDCFVTRMLEEQTGAFWDETIYSPKDSKNGKNLSIPLKSTGKEGYLDPKKYGGKSSTKQAYWFIFTAKDKKGRDQFFFEGMPIHMCQKIKDNDALLAYAEKIAHEKNCTDARVLRRKICLRQKLIYDGAEYYLYGSTGGQNEVRPATELVANADLTKNIYNLFDETETIDEKTCQTIYQKLSSTLISISPKLFNIMKLNERYCVFSKLSLAEKESLLKGIINKLNCTAQTVDTRCIGGAKTAALLLVTINASLKEIIWIDQSVTGIFETRTTFEDLCNDAGL